MSHQVRPLSLIISPPVCSLLESIFTPTPVPLSKLIAGATSQELALFASLPALLDGRS